MPGGGLRQNIQDLAHAPFQEEIAQRFLWLFGLGPDGVLEKLNQGIHNRFVLQAHPTTLPYLAADRGNIVKGLTEPDESWRTRIQRAIIDWPLAGSSWAVLSQVLGYLLSLTPPARIVSTLYVGNVPDSTQWDRYDAGDDPTTPPRHRTMPTAEWDWDSDSPTVGSWGWWRWYLVIESTAPHEWIGTAGPWGAAGTWGSPIGAWGVSQPKEVGRSLRVIVGQWKANTCHWIIISFDATEFQPAGAGLPAGEYGHWSKVVDRHHQRARSSNGRYFRGPKE
jgi:hypothetical protein